jgi:hypothetical protein
MGVVIHRNPDEDPTRTDLYIRKVRFKSVGKIGVVCLRWDVETGRYSELAPATTASSATVNVTTEIIA